MCVCVCALGEHFISELTLCHIMPVPCTTTTEERRQKSRFHYVFSQNIAAHTGRERKDQHTLHWQCLISIHLFSGFTSFRCCRSNHPSSPERSQLEKEKNQVKTCVWQIIGRDTCTNTTSICPSTFSTSVWFGFDFFLLLLLFVRLLVAAFFLLLADFRLG